MSAGTVNPVGAFWNWIIHGHAEGGECPECGGASVRIEEFDIRCAQCDFEAEFPEVPAWL